MITCKQCKQEKTEDSFHWANRQKERRHKDCKQCRSIAGPKEWLSGGRTCNSCGQYKVLAEFCVRRSGSPNAVCKLCTKIKRSQVVHPELDPTKTRGCASCKQDKLLIEFPRNRNSAAGRLNICKPCYVEKNLHRTYSISQDRLDQMVSEQDGRCKICLREFGVERSAMKHIDHDHSCCPGQTSCGKCVRGLLCGACNLGLGTFRDNPAYLRAAAVYLESF